MPTAETGVGVETADVFPARFSCCHAYLTLVVHHLLLSIIYQGMRSCFCQFGVSDIQQTALLVLMTGRSLLASLPVIGWYNFLDLLVCFCFACMSILWAPLVSACGLTARLSLQSLCLGYSTWALTLSLHCSSQLLFVAAANL